MLFLATVELCPAQRSKGNAEYRKVEQSYGSACQRSVTRGAEKVKHGRAG